MRRKCFFLCALLALPLYLSSLPLDLTLPIWESDQSHDILGLRDKMGEKGLYILPSYIQDLDWPTTGGIKSSDYPLYLYLFSLELGVDFKKLLGLKGTLGYLNFLSHSGKFPSRDFVGDFQGFDNLEGYSLTQLSELWLQQNFFEGKCEIRVGKIDTYGIFIYTPFAQNFINNSYSQFPTIVSYPSYPNPAVGIVLNAHPKPWIDLRASIFDGSGAQGVKTGNLGAKPFFQNLGKHLLFLNEVDFSWACTSLFGQAIVGFWAFNGRLTNFNGETSGKSAGPFLSLSQTLWKQKPLRARKQSEVGAFCQWGYANQEISDAKFFLSGGISYQNIVKVFHSDSLNIGASTVYFSQSRGAPYTQSYETSLELTYLFTPYRGISIQPDLQWILQPGGGGRKNALVALLRISVSI